MFVDYQYQPIMTTGIYIFRLHRDVNFLSILAKVKIPAQYLSKSNFIARNSQNFGTYPSFLVKAKIFLYIF